VDVIRITLPPLRERIGDLPALAAYFLSLQHQRGLPQKTFTPQAMRVLEAYSWPGNIRELANTVERLVILTPRSTIDVVDLPENIRFHRPSSTASDEQSLTLAEVERRHILRVVEAAGGNLTAAARRLEVDRGTLHRKIQQWQEREARQRSA
jgi:two-component system response regulator HydG